MEDTKIVDLYLARDEEAIARSREKFDSRLRALAGRILHSEPDAEEMAGDTYLSAWNAIPPHEPRTYLYAFLARITRCLSLNRCRQKQREQRGALVVELSAELEECLPSPDDTESRLADAEFGRLLDAFLETLNVKARNIFLRRYWYALPLSEISRQERATESAVKSSLFHTRQKLKAYLTEKGVSV